MNKSIFLFFGSMVMVSVSYGMNPGGQTPAGKAAQERADRELALRLHAEEVGHVDQENIPLESKKRPLSTLVADGPRKKSLLYFGRVSTKPVQGSGKRTVLRPLVKSKEQEKKNTTSHSVSTSSQSVNQHIPNTSSPLKGVVTQYNGFKQVGLSECGYVALFNAIWGQCVHYKPELIAAHDNGIVRKIINAWKTMISDRRKNGAESSIPGQQLTREEIEFLAKETKNCQDIKNLFLDLGVKDEIFESSIWFNQTHVTDAILSGSNDPRNTQNLEQSIDTQLFLFDNDAVANTLARSLCSRFQGAPVSLIINTALNRSLEEYASVSGGWSDHWILVVLIPESARVSFLFMDSLNNSYITYTPLLEKLHKIITSSIPVLSAEQREVFFQLQTALANKRSSSPVVAEVCEYFEKVIALVGDQRSGEFNHDYDFARDLIKELFDFINEKKLFVYEDEAIGAWVKKFVLTNNA